jgi:hypothetical protein
MNISLKAELESLGVNVDALSAGIQTTLRLQVGELAKAAQGEWIRLAQSRLNSSREEYIKGLQAAGSFVPKRSASGDSYEITLVGQFPNDLEFGKGPFDMKTARPGWLGGKKAKVGKDGSTYVTIPFRHSTSNSPRFNYTGKAAAISSPDLKTHLRQTVKDFGLDKMIRTATGKVVTNGGKAVKTLPKGSAPHPYLEGLSRYQTASSGTSASGKQRGGGTLMTFRRMSTKSDPSSWIHPGLEAVNLLQEVESYVEREMSVIARNVMGV